MKARMHLSIIIITATALISSCSKGSESGGGTGSTGGGGGPSQPGPLFLAVRSVITTHCATAGCHTGTNAQSGINFSDDNQIVGQRARIKVRAVDQAGTSNQMPPPPQAPLSTADRQKIVDWINAGGGIGN